jgi:hypothetical protein
MTFASRPLTAIERAHIAYEAMMQRQREVAMQRQAKLHARRIRFVILSGVAFAVLMGLAIRYDWMPTSLRSLTLQRGQAPNHFVDSRTGHVRSFVKGDTCQELHFNNDSGAFVGGNVVACKTEPNNQAALPPSRRMRMNSIRDAFTR